MFDPAPITRHLRAKAASHLLVAAVHHLHIFEELSRLPLSFEELRHKLDLAERPAMVLFPALCAMKLLQYDGEGRLEVTPLGRFLLKETPENLIGYVGLEAEDPGVLRMVEWLKNDGPAGGSQGFSYVKDEHAPSPMDEPEAARFFTMALAGRAKYLSPVVASKMTRREGHLVDVAAGTGYYSYEWLLANPGSTATIVDRPEVLKIAREILDSYGNAALTQRVNFHAADMLMDDIPKGDMLLAASLFHDWPSETCRTLMQKFASAINEGGELWVHDAFLDDTLDGPLAVTDYSAMLFLGTKGRAYSRKEYRAWFAEVGLMSSGINIPTLLDYSLISATKTD